MRKRSINTETSKKKKKKVWPEFRRQKGQAKGKREKKPSPCVWIGRMMMRSGCVREREGEKRDRGTQTKSLRGGRRTGTEGKRERGREREGEEERQPRG